MLMKALTVITGTCVIIDALNSKDKKRIIELQCGPVGATIGCNADRSHGNLFQGTRYVPIKTT